LLVLTEDNDASVEFELGMGGVGGTAIRRSWRQVWRGGGELVVVVIVEIGGGQGWRVAMILVEYITTLEHGEEETSCSVTCVLSLSPSVGCVLGIGMVKIGGKKKKDGERRANGI